jgi:hypothetical protein
MYSLSFSVFCYLKFRIFKVLNMIRWTVAPRFISETGITWTQMVLWWFQTSNDLLFYQYVLFAVVFLFCSGPRSDKLLMSADTVLRSVVYRVVLAGQYCIKVSVEFWTTDCLLAHFLTIYSMFLVCVLSAAQNQQQLSLQSFYLYS